MPKAPPPRRRIPASSPPSSPSSSPTATHLPFPSSSRSPSVPSPSLRIHTRLGIPTRRAPPRTRHTPSLTKRVVLYDCQTPGHTVHTYVFETHLNNVPIPIDPAGDAGLLARVRTPKCPLPARQGVVRQVGRMKGPPGMFGAPDDGDDEAEDMEADEELAFLDARIRAAASALRALDARVKTSPSFALRSDAFWAQHRLSALRLRRTALRAQLSPLISALDGADEPSSRVLLLRALSTPVRSRAALRAADYVAALVLAHIAVLRLNAATRTAQVLGAEAVRDEVAPLALLRLALGAVLEDAAFWDAGRRESRVTMRRWLERWGDEAGEGVEVGGVLDELGVL